MVEDYYKNGWKSKAFQLKEKNILEEGQAVSLKAMIDSPDDENFVLAKELLRLKIADALVDGLNDGQTKAFVSIIDYFREPNENIGVVLKGYAGTGKTYLVKRIIEYIMAAYPNRKVAITAPTNKAVHVLARNSPFDDNTTVFEDYGEPDDNIVYCTIHKLLGLKEQISDSGVQSFVASTGKNQRSLDSYHYIIVDEVSMLSDDLFMKLIPFRDRIKFIFMGGIRPYKTPQIDGKTLRTLHTNLSW